LRIGEWDAMGADAASRTATAGFVRSHSQYDPAVPDAQRLLADRMAIDDVLTLYATLIDSRRFDELDQVFTSDAVLDYRSAGGVRGPYPEVRDWLASVLPAFTWTQHLVVNRAVELSPGADHATCRSLFYNPNSMQIDGRPWLFVVGGAYHDRLVRTDSGWRIRHRVEETIWWDNPMPGLDAVPPPLPADCFD
jgi:SnoaL-like domain